MNENSQIDERNDVAFVRSRTHNGSVCKCYEMRCNDEGETYEIKKNA